jgi:hypothetical protein
MKNATLQRSSRVSVSPCSILSKIATAPSIYRVEVSFDVLPPEERNHFDRIGTNFSLDRGDVDRLIAVAGKVMEESEEYAKLVKELQ